MKDFAGRIAVVTGGGSGMGRELVLQLVAEGCNIAMCDISAAGIAETHRLCEVAGLPQGLRLTTHVADVSDAAQVEQFRDEVANRHDTDRVHLLFNNAGIGGGGSMIAHTREEWERTFNVCWGGVYNCTRAFLPMLQRADAGHIVNTSSVNGFWASIGPRVPHTAYSAAKAHKLPLSDAGIISHLSPDNRRDARGQEAEGPRCDPGGRPTGRIYGSKSDCSGGSGIKLRSYLGDSEGTCPIALTTELLVSFRHEPLLLNADRLGSPARLVGRSET